MQRGRRISRVREDRNQEVGFGWYLGGAVECI